MQVVSQQVMKVHEAPSRATYRVCAGDIITAISGASTGTAKHATALITEEEEGAICSNGLAVLRNVRGVNLLFLLCYLRTPYFLRQVRRLLTGHAIPAISLNDLANVLVPIPSPEVQQAVAESVCRLQDLRRRTLRLGKQVVNEVESALRDLLL